MSTTKYYYNWLNIAKGITIFLVVMGHVNVTFAVKHMYEDVPFFSTTCMLIYKFRMPLFMMVSGFLCCNTMMHKAPKKHGTLVKLLAYGVPYLAFSLLLFVYKVFISESTDWTLIDLLLIPLYPLSFMWFIYALMIMTLIQNRIGLRSKYLTGIQLLVAILLYFLNPIFIEKFHEVRWEDMILSDLSRMYLFYLGGFMSYKYIVQMMEKKSLCIFIFVVSLWLFFISLSDFLNQSYISMMIMNFIAATSASFVVIIVSSWLSNVNFLNEVGKNTLPIYVLHSYFISIGLLLFKLFDFNDSQGILLWSGLTIFATLTPYYLHKLLLKRSIYTDFVFRPTKYIVLS